MAFKIPEYGRQFVRQAGRTQSPEAAALQPAIIQKQGEIQKTLFEGAVAKDVVGKIGKGAIDFYVAYEKARNTVDLRQAKIDTEKAINEKFLEFQERPDYANFEQDYNELLSELKPRIEANMSSDAKKEYDLWFQDTTNKTGFSLSQSVITRSHQDMLGVMSNIFEDYTNDPDGQFSYEQRVEGVTATADEMYKAGLITFVQAKEAVSSSIKIIDYSQARSDLRANALSHPDGIIAGFQDSISFLHAYDTSTDTGKYSTLDNTDKDKLIEGLASEMATEYARITKENTAYQVKNYNFTLSEMAKGAIYSIDAIEVLEATLNENNAPGIDLAQKTGLINLNTAAAKAKLLELEEKAQTGIDLRMDEFARGGRGMSDKEELQLEKDLRRDFPFATDTMISEALTEVDTQTDLLILENEKIAKSVLERNMDWYTQDNNYLLLPEGKRDEMLASAAKMAEFDTTTFNEFRALDERVDAEAFYIDNFEKALHGEYTEPYRERNSGNITRYLDEDKEKELLKLQNAWELVDATSDDSIDPIERQKALNGLFELELQASANHNKVYSQELYDKYETGFKIKHPDWNGPDTDTLNKVTGYWNEASVRVYDAEKDRIMSNSTAERSNFTLQINDFVYNTNLSATDRLANAGNLMDQLDAGLASASMIDAREKSFGTDYYDTRNELRSAMKALESATKPTEEDSGRFQEIWYEVMFNEDMTDDIFSKYIEDFTDPDPEKSELTIDEVNELVRTQEWRNRAVESRVEVGSGLQELNDMFNLASDRESEIMDEYRDKVEDPEFVYTKVRINKEELSFSQYAFVFGGSTAPIAGDDFDVAGGEWQFTKDTEKFKDAQARSQAITSLQRRMQSEFTDTVDEFDADGITEFVAKYKNSYEQLVQNEMSKLYADNLTDWVEDMGGWSNFTDIKDLKGLDANIIQDLTTRFEGGTTAVDVRKLKDKGFYQFDTTLSYTDTSFQLVPIGGYMTFTTTGELLDADFTPIWQKQIVNGQVDLVEVGGVSPEGFAHSLAEMEEMIEVAVTKDVGGNQ